MCIRLTVLVGKDAGARAAAVAIAVYVAAAAVATTASKRQLVVSLAHCVAILLLVCVLLMFLLVFYSRMHRTLLSAIIRPYMVRIQVVYIEAHGFNVSSMSFAVCIVRAQSHTQRNRFERVN